MGNLVSVTTASQVSQYSVGYLIQGHTREENHHTRQKLGTGKPLLTVFASLAGDGPTIQIAIAAY